MKLIRLPSGPLACVCCLSEQHQRGSKASGVYRAFSGSVEAVGASESAALDALDEEVRRLSEPPPPEVTAFELSRLAANDSPSAVDIRREQAALRTGRFLRYCEPATLPAPTSSSRAR